MNLLQQPDPALQRKIALAQAMSQQGQQQMAQPNRAWQQNAAALANTLLGAFMGKKYQGQQDEANKAFQDKISAAAQTGDMQALAQALGGTDAGINMQIEEMGRKRGEEDRLKQQKEAETRENELKTQENEEWDRRFGMTQNAKTTTSKPSLLGQLISEMQSLPEGDPSRKYYESMIGKQTTHSPGTTVNVGGEGGYKIPPGYMLKDPNDLSVGVTPIPGGNADEIAGEAAGKTQMLRTASEGAKKIDSLLFNKDGSVNFANVTNMSLGTPKTEGRQLRNYFDYGIQAITRLETGAAMPPEELNNTRDRFQPSMFDDEKLIKTKLAMFKDFINGGIKLIDPSGRFDDQRFEMELNSRMSGDVTPNIQSGGKTIDWKDL